MASQKTAAGAARDAGDPSERPATGLEGAPVGDVPAERSSTLAPIGEATPVRGEVEAEDGVQTLFEYDPSTNRLSWSDLVAAERIIGSGLDESGDAFPLSDFLGRCAEVASVQAGDERRSAFQGRRAGYCCRYQLRRLDDGLHWVEERGGWIGAGKQKRLIGVMRSIEIERRRDERLALAASTDELTGLLNRIHLRQHLAETISAAGAAGRQSAYLLAGIDDVGAINADFGFESADAVIIEIARRLSSALGPDDAIGRVAGTKFGIVVVECDETAVRSVCARMMNAVRESVIDTKKGGVSASICVGAVALPDDGDDPHVAMARAEAALDAAKQQGRSSWSAYSEKTERVSLRRRNTHMSDVILTALNERRVRLAFQPIVSDMGEEPRKFECLIRMRGDDGQEIPAPEFIPAAERLGLVHLLDRRVLELATNTLCVCPNIHLNVNISMETVKDFVWAEGYISHLRANEDLARRITVELTETQVIDAIDSSIEFVSEIKKVGCAFGIDDFGAGYTSFRNLKAMDIDILKIDGSFVTGVASSRENQLFVRTLLDLARNFGMKTVAEWVDNEADAMLLKGLGVDYLQGFLLGKPETQPYWLPEGAPTEAPRRVGR